MNLRGNTILVTGGGKEVGALKRETTLQDFCTKKVKSLYKAAESGRFEVIFERLNSAVSHES